MQANPSQHPTKPYGIHEAHAPRRADPGTGRQGQGDFGRKLNFGDSYSEPEDYLNDPIARLLDELRADAEGAIRRGAFAASDHRGKVERRVEAASAPIIARAKLSYETRNSVSLAVMFQDNYFAKQAYLRVIGQQIEAAWPNRKPEVVTRAVRLAQALAERASD